MQWEVLANLPELEPAHSQGQGKSGFCESSSEQGQIYNQAKFSLGLNSAKVGAPGDLSNLHRSQLMGNGHLQKIASQGQNGSRKRRNYVTQKH